eukprot:COSAG01_NODE_7594_length_3134_cov_5.924547_5_plen_80_part_00
MEVLSLLAVRCCYSGAADGGCIFTWGEGGAPGLRSSVDSATPAGFARGAHLPQGGRSGGIYIPFTRQRHRVHFSPYFKS